MQSNHQEIDVRPVLKLFLTTIGEDMPAWTLEGLCNAHTFLTFRSLASGESKKHFNRMKNLSSATKEDIVNMGKLYLEYKRERRFLASITDESNRIGALNTQIINVEKELAQFTEEKSTRILEKRNELKILRQKRNQLIDDEIKDQFTQQQWKIIKEAHDIYIYTHTLLNAFNPGRKFNYKINGKAITQSDFIEIMYLLTPDKLLIESKSIEKELKLPFNKAFQIAFNFTDKELVSLFKNQMTQDPKNEITFNEGDYIKLSSSDHAMLLHKLDGIYYLFDSMPIEIKPNTPEALVAKIKERFFTRFKISSEYLPLGISVFEKTDTPITKSRSNPKDIIQRYLYNRSGYFGFFATPIDAPAWDGTTSLLMAAKLGYTETVIDLLKQKADINAKDQKGVSALLLATQNGHLETIKLLIEKKADVATKDINGDSAVSIAAQNGFVDILQEFRTHHLHFEEPNKKEITPAWFAAQNGQADVIEYFIQQKIDVLKPEESKISPLGIAAIMGHSNVIRLLNRVDDINKPINGSTPTFLAALSGSESSIYTLAELKADLNFECKTFSPAHIAAYKGHLNVLYALDICGADLINENSKGYTPLFNAVSNQQWHVSAYLLTKIKQMPENLEEKLTKPSIVQQMLDSFLDKMDELKISNESKAALYKKTLDAENALGKLLLITAQKKSSSQIGQSMFVKDPLIQKLQTAYQKLLGAKSEQKMPSKSKG